MSNTLPTLLYSKKDPQDILENVKAMLPGLTNDQWTDFLDSDIGYALIKTFVGILDRHLYWTDQQASEMFLSFCRTREAAVRLAQGLNYPIASATPATVPVKLTFPAFNSQIEINENSLWLINNLPFTCLSPIVVPPNQTELQISLVQGSPYSLNKTATGAAWMAITVPLNVANLVVKVDNEEWQKVDSFIGVTNEKSYKFDERSKGQVITFGANVGTLQPAQGAAIAITGILTDGKKGNLPVSGYPVVPVTSIYNSLNQNVTNSFTGQTIDVSSGGKDVESIESIKQNASKFYTTQGRVVTKEDYEAVIATIQDVFESKVIPGQTIKRYGEVHVIIAGQDPYTVSPDLMQQVYDTLAAKNMLTVSIIVKPPIVVELELEIDAGFDPSIVPDLSFARNAVDNVISDVFSSLKIESNLYESDTLSAVKSIPGCIWARQKNLNLVSFAHSQGGKISIPVISNFDLTSCVLKKQDGTVLFSGDGTSKEVLGAFGFTNQMADQKCKLFYKPNSDDILLNSMQKLVLTKLTINASYV